MQAMHEDLASSVDNQGYMTNMLLLWTWTQYGINVRRRHGAANRTVESRVRGKHSAPASQRQALINPQQTPSKLLDSSPCFLCKGFPRLASAKSPSISTDRQCSLLDACAGALCIAALTTRIIRSSDSGSFSPRWLKSTPTASCRARCLTA
ncbi:hypothetical protein N656DRAFT_39343 [Canariomyces notabilis]|uniref:Uncharacterized protein n=1 Tax=Canariomyces notabilis TaxID=2074819 RepID=A0AAN6YX90_9PEZI|nr:hypothetical protein N656DRAFT_39343 [Canariomyces arenarius]